MIEILSSFWVQVSGFFNSIFPSFGWKDAVILAILTVLVGKFIFQFVKRVKWSGFSSVLGWVLVFLFISLTAGFVHVLDPKTHVNIPRSGVFVVIFWNVMWWMLVSGLFLMARRFGILLKHKVLLLWDVFLIGAGSVLITLVFEGFLDKTRYYTYMLCAVGVLAVLMGAVICFALLKKLKV